jgi:hypothetical protein
MKNHKLARYFLILLIVLAALGLALANISATKQEARSVSQSRGAASARTLKEKAKQAGKFVGYEQPNDAAAYPGLDQLVGNSAAVVIGIAQQNVCRLSPDGEHISIDYQVKVEYVYKGTVRQGNTITVSLPGGMVHFADGTSAEVRTPWFKKMQQGATYLLFLNQAAADQPFVTTGAAQGLFEIPTTLNSRVVKTHTGVLKDPIWKYNGMDVKAFLKEVRQAVKKADKG